MHEVIADGPLQTDQYYSVGKVTEFNGCYFVQCIRGGDLNCLYNFGHEFQGKDGAMGCMLLFLLITMTINEEVGC